MPDPARRHPGLYWSAVLLSLVAIVGGSVVAYATYQGTAGPAGAVRGYFSALEDADAARALAYGDLPLGPHSLLTANVLREQQTIAPIRDFKIVSVDQRGSDATVSVGYNLRFTSGTEVVVDTVPVHRRGSSWRLVETAVPTAIGITQAADRASILGAAVPDGRTLIFPGAVPVRFDTPNLQVAAGTGAVAFTSGPELALTVEVSATGRKAVAGAITAELKTCFAAPGKAGLSCPLPAGGFVPGSLTGRLTGSVADHMTLDVATSGAGVIDVSGSVAVRGAYRKLDFDNIASAHRGTVQIPLDASTYAQPIELQWTVEQ